MLAQNLQNSISVIDQEENYFLCKSIELTNESVIYKHIQVFSPKCLFMDRFLSVKTSDASNISFEEPLSVWVFQSLRNYFSFAQNVESWEQPENCFLLTFKINGNLYQLHCNEILLNKGLFVINNPDHFSFFKNDKNIAFLDRPFVAGESDALYQGGAIEVFGILRDVKAIIRYDKKSVVIPIFYLSKILQSISLS